MKRILFVDDDDLVLETIESMFKTTRNEWDLCFAHSGSEALQLMEKQPADVVVSDMRMPKMNGATLLNEIMHRHPRTVRFILSGYADMELVMNCVGGTHQFLSKPDDITTLQSSVRRAVDMDAWLNNDQVKTLVSQLSTVPSVPTVYFQIMKELRSPEATLEIVGATIAQDPAMTAKMLQLVNSAFFGLAHKVNDPTDAVMHLGMATIKSLVLGIHLFTELQSAKGSQVEMEKIFHHSLSTAATAKRIAKMEGQKREVVEESFTAGLLHDIGRLVLFANLPEHYAEAITHSQRCSISLVEAERAVFGVTHAETGGYLLGLWGLPIPIVEAALFHHNPSSCHSEGFNSLTAVHVANVLEPNRGMGHSPALLPQLDHDYIAKAGLTDRYSHWAHTFSSGHAE